MEKTKIKRMMAESILVRETALEAFESSLSTLSFSEAMKVLKAHNVESLKELKDKVVEGDIKAEELDIPDKKEDKKKEAVDDSEDKDESKKEAVEDEDEDELKEGFDRLASMIEGLHNRIKMLESVPGPGFKKGQVVDTPDGEGKFISRDGDIATVDINGKNKTFEYDKLLPESVQSDSGTNDDDTSGDDVTKKQVDPDTGDMPTKKKSGDEIVSGEEPKAGKMESVESDDAKDKKDSDEKEPTPPVVKESFGYSMDVRKEKLINRSADRFNNLFS